jgi:hypothetical protein
MQIRKYNVPEEHLVGKTSTHSTKRPEGTPRAAFGSYLSVVLVGQSIVQKK